MGGSVYSAARDLDAVSDASLRFKGEEGMDSEAPTSSDRSRTNWTTPMDHYFIELLLDQVYRGNKIGHVFGKQAWAEMIALFNTKCGFQYDMDVLKNRYKSLRKQYNDIKILLNQNGFIWDETRQIVTADNRIWDDYIKAHPSSRSYKTKVLPYYNDLCVICGHAIADGRYSLSCLDVDLDNEGKRIVSQTPISDDRTKVDWTSTMDHCFVELMLDQVHKGNKIGHTFKKKAWAHMITLFNTKFEFEYDKDILKNRYKSLRRQYNSLKILLGQSGFSWDETQQMVTADDHVWDDYVKAHPNVRVYRNKIIPYYNGLCVICGGVICGDATGDKRCSRKKKMGGVSGGLQSMVMPVPCRVPMDDAHEESSHSGGDKNISNQQNKHLSKMPSTSQHSNKRARRTDNDMEDALREMAVAVTSLTNKKEENDNPTSTENVIDVLQAITGIDEDLLLDACDFLEDEKRAKMFLALDARLRKKWLVRKLRP
ncbi:hypothetical protein HHK36_016928 [Tetracentron sinense]|uniref:Myb/SANT-like domain-containing protein n=1 Tax=Tetracentron sinense TaxID=13715 RepID=A0A834Z6P9_TETSI|nr:hypothetical protein HHK36_016928 [Tetracentron sinense]